MEKKNKQNISFTRGKSNYVLCTLQKSLVCKVNNIIEKLRVFNKCAFIISTAIKQTGNTLSD